MSYKKKEMGAQRVSDVELELETKEDVGGAEENMNQLAFPDDPLIGHLTKEDWQHVKEVYKGEIRWEQDGYVASFKRHTSTSDNIKRNFTGVYHHGAPINR